MRRMGVLKHLPPAHRPMSFGNPGSLTATRRLEFNWPHLLALLCETVRPFLIPEAWVEEQEVNIWKPRKLTLEIQNRPIL